jgi:hypothetical protein
MSDSREIAVRAQSAVTRAWSDLYLSAATKSRA